MAKEANASTESRGVDRETILRRVVHPLKLRILKALTKSPKGEMYVNELAEALKASRQLVSFHLIELSELGLVESEYFISQKPASKGRAVKMYKSTPLASEIKEEIKALL